MIKNITKIEQKRLFFFTFSVSFVMAFLTQKLIYTINDLTLCLAHFFNKIIYWTYLFQEFMRKDDLNVHVFQ